MSSIVKWLRRYGPLLFTTQKDKTITFTLKGKNYCINSDIILAFFQLPENNKLVPHTDTDVSSMLIFMGYSFDPAK